jgi:hypothetical protein
MEQKDEFGSQRFRGERCSSDFVLGAQHALSEERGQLTVAQEPAGGLDLAGGTAWR